MMPTMRVMILIIISILVLGLLWFLLQSQDQGTTEQFQSIDGIQTDLLDTSRSAEGGDYEEKRNTFHYQLNPENKSVSIIPIFPGPTGTIPTSEIQAAFDTRGPDGNPLKNMFKAISNNGVFSKLFRKIETRDEEELVCRTAATPENLPADGTCGWWYVANPYHPSIGTKKRKLEEGGVEAFYKTDLADMFPGGEFITDMRRAAALERIKRCSRITDCSLINTAAADGCIFCPIKGRAVPTSIPYLDDLKDPILSEQAACSGGGIKNPAQCPPRQVNPVYIDGDYDYDINGNLRSGANTAAIDTYNKGATDIDTSCTPVSGALSKTCRATLCDSVGIAAGKGLRRMIETGSGPTSEKDRLALYIVDRRGGVQIPNSLIMDGEITKDDAAEVLGRLRALATSGPLGRSRDAAKWLMFETPFEECPTGEDERGPFSTECLQREFKRVGCQASGSAFPTSGSAAMFDTMRVSDVRMQFRDLYDRMNSAQGLPADQDEAVKACLGIQIQREKNGTEEWDRNPNSCRDPGIEYYRFKVGEDGRRILMDRIISPTLITGGRDGNSFMGRFYISGGDGTVEKIALAEGSQGVLRVNGRPVQQGESAIIPARQRSMVEIEGGVLGLVGLEPSRFLLGQAVWKPMISLDAVEGVGWRDTNQILRAPTTSVERVDSHWAVPLRGGVPMIIPVDLGGMLLRTITCMLRWTTLDTQATIFQFDDGTTGSSATSVGLQMIEKIPTIIVKSASATYQYRFKGAANVFGKPNVWRHLTVQFGETVRFFVDGKEYVDPAPNKTGIFNPRISVFSRLLLGGAGITGMMSWFHVYDRGLDIGEIQRDMGFDDPRLRDSDANIPNMGPRAGDLFHLEKGIKMVDVVPTRTTKELSLDACARAAAAYHLTTAFLYDGASKSCSLFQYTKSERTDASGSTVLGTKPYFIKKGFELEGRPLAVFQNVVLADECGDLCSERKKCGGWSHNRSDKTCRLMKSVSDAFVPTNKEGITSARMANNTPARNAVLARGACAEGYAEYGLGQNTSIPGKCCPTPGGILSGSNGLDYQVCQTSGIGRQPCTMNVNDGSMRKC